MNKHLHKIIFNKKRGCMMAVAEHAAREGKSTQDSSARAGFTLQAGMPMLAACGVLLGGIGFAQAQIIADKSAPANQQAAVLKHSSGAPLVNIQTPTAKGLSHNRYTQFDVDNKGAVLNNSRTANPNLAKGSAKVILNEIRSTSPSKLAGIISVEGSRADVIIANPAGIQVNGGGFKNANRAVLTTGAPVIKEGALHQLDIRQGTVAIGAGGLNDAGSTGAGYTEILSRAATVQGKIQANQLTIATGAQKIDYASGEISNGSAAGTKPALAIDTAALGSMYAGSITLIANEKGLGVKNAGTLQAERQLVLTSAGKIENSGQIRTTSAATEAAPTYLSLTTTDQAANSGNGDIDSTAGKIESKGLMVVDAGRDLVLSNTALNQSNVQTASAIILDAGRHIQINKKAALTNSGSGAISAAAGGNITINDAKFGSSGQIYTAAQGSNHLQNNSTLNAKQDISILANGNVQLNAGHLASSAGSIHLEAAKPASLAANPAPANANISGGSLSAAKNIVALADNDISATTTIKAAEAVYLHAGKNLNLTVGAELPAATQNVSLKAGEKAGISAAAQKNLNAAKDLSIAAGSITVERLNLKAGSGNLSLSAQSGDLGLAPNTQLNAGQNIEAAALQGNIVSDGLNATAANGHLSIMAAGRVDLLSIGTATAKLSGKTGVALGSVGKGRLKTDNTDITAAEGDIRLVSGADMIIGNGKQQNTLLAHHIQAQSSNGALSINHAKISATRGALQLEAKQDLTLSQVAATSSQNTTIAADAGKVHLNQVNAGAGRHMAISSRNNQILQNDKQSTANTLKANGVLSIHSGWWHNANNSQMQGGAVHLKSNGSAITLGGNSSVKALSNPVLKNDAKLKSLDGSINIEAKSDVHIQPGYTVAADGNFHLKAGNKLTLAGKSGNKGNPSATTSTLSAKGEIKLIAGEADIQAAKIAAGKDLTVGTTKGKLNIDAVSSKFSDYTPEQKVAELRRDIRALEQQIEAAKKANAKDKRLAAWDNEKGRLEFYIQAINKTVKGHKPKGYEYKQATLSGQNINLISAQGIEVSGSDVLAEKKLNIQAAGILPKVGDQTQSAIFIDGVADSYEIGLQRFKSHYDKAVINKPSRLQGKQGITIQAPAANDNARIIIGASQLNAPNGRIDIKAYGDILLESGENNAYTFLKTKSRSGSVLRKTKFTHNTNHLIMPAPVELNSGVGIGLQAGGNIDAYSTRFNAPKGKIALVAGEELNLLAVEGQHSHRFETNKSTRFVGLKIKNKDYKREELTETKLPVKMIARGVNTRSGWDTVLEGTEFETGLAGADIQAGVGEKAKADAKIILQGIKTTVQKEESSKSNAVVWQSMAGSGSVVETLALPKFEGPTPPKLSAPGGYIVDIPKGQLKTEIEKLARQPEYAYLKQLQLSKDVNWNQVQLEYQKWDYKQEGLTGAGAAIIALALAAVTGGAGAGIATALSGTVVTGTSAAMANAAFLSLATQASISLVNNKGNLGKTFKELGRSSTVKNLATAVITAGVADKIGATSALNSTSNTEWVNNLSVNLANGGSSAVIGTAINGGSLQDSLESAILSALVQTAHGAAASKIKDLDNHYIAHKVAHAVAGCAAAAANKGKCQDGAIGAAVGEIVGEKLLGGRDLSKLPAAERAAEEAKIIAYSRLVAGTAAGLTGGDVNVAADAAKVAVENNTLREELILEVHRHDEFMNSLSPSERQQWQKAFQDADLETLDIAAFAATLYPITGGSVRGIKWTADAAKTFQAWNATRLITVNFVKNPKTVWGKSAVDIAKQFERAGYSTTIRSSNRQGSLAKIVEIKGHPSIQQIQIHPGGGRHAGAYYKLSTTNKGVVKVVDKGTYIPTVGEKAQIIYK